MEGGESRIAPIGDEPREALVGEEAVMAIDHGSGSCAAATGDGQSSPQRAALGRR
jgi:hypothetical protein